MSKKYGRYFTRLVTLLCLLFATAVFTIYANSLQGKLPSGNVKADVMPSDQLATETTVPTTVTAAETTPETTPEPTPTPAGAHALPEILHATMKVLHATTKTQHS